MALTQYSTVVGGRGGNRCEVRSGTQLPDRWGGGVLRDLRDREFFPPQTKKARKRSAQVRFFLIFCTSSKLRKNQGAERWKVFYSLIFIYTVKNPPVSEYSSESVRSVRKMLENIIGEKIRQWVRWHSATSLHRVTRHPPLKHEMKELSL